MADESLKIFINYRRADNRVFVELIRTWFMMKYDRNDIFMDFDSIVLFTDFARFIRQKIRESDAVVVIIGPRWLNLMQQKAAARETDYVRIEIEEALKHHKMIAPICIEGASVPHENQIPESLRPILALNIAHLQSGTSNFYDNMPRIINAVEVQVRQRSRKPIAPTPEIAPPSDEPFDVLAALDNFVDAFTLKTWHDALTWAQRIKASGEALPGTFPLEELENYEARAQQAFQAEEEARRREEMAAFQYAGIHRLVRLKAAAHKIHAALEQVWQIVPGYDPDNLAKKYPKPEPPKVESASSPAASSEPGSLSAASTEPGGFNPWSSSDREKPASQPDINTTILKILPAPFEWIEIPAGPFLMGSDRRKDKLAQDREPDLHEITLPAFYIAKYPLTWGQYEIFVNDGGYNEQSFWTAAGWKWKTEKNRTVPVYWNNSKFHIANHPVNGISWYESIAFTRWLSQKAGYEIRLPTEAEWEKAARGTDGRIFPWGDEFDASKCNMKDSGIGTTTPVDKYPQGASPYGVLDMSGNAYNWCLSPWTNPYKHHEAKDVDLEGSNSRILKGGYYDNSIANVRAAFRFGYNPFFRYSYDGARLCCSRVPHL